MAARYRYPPCAVPQYVSSKIEAQWLSRSAVNRICVTTMLQSTVAHDGWLPYAADVSGENGDRKPRDGAEADAISTLSCSGDELPRSHLEPLTGMARHPCARVGCLVNQNAWRRRCAQPVGLPGVDVSSTSHLVPLNWCGRPPLARSVLFDVGAGGPNEVEWLKCREKLFAIKAEAILDHTNASAGTLSSRLGHHDSKSAARECKATRYRGGASVPSWIERYARRCIHFDRIFAWEARPYNQPAWWATLTPLMRMRTSFYNVRVDAEPEAPATADAPPVGMSVLSWLKHTVTPDDFVVLKLDIDHSPTELSIMHAIAADSRLLALVDELWFEYHFRFDHGVEFGWKETHFNHTVDEALRLMHKLRSRGVRAHFWV